AVDHPLAAVGQGEGGAGVVRVCAGHELSLGLEWLADYNKWRRSPKSCSAAALAGARRPCGSFRAVPEAKRVQGGESTSDLVNSAHVGDNGELFARIMALHVPPRSKVADVTYGKGVFWRRIAPGTYDLLASDIELGSGEQDMFVEYRDKIDCRALPYDDRSLDCVVLDP